MLRDILKRIRYNLLSPMPYRYENKPIKDRIRKIRYNLFGNLPFLGRKKSVGETAKAHGRREREGFFKNYCQGFGLDVGYGGDPVVENVRGWDFEHGDAQLLRGLDDASFDFVYSSHLLEHLPDADVALSNWWRVLKPGGYLLLYLPHRDLYEKKTSLPSRFNPDHVHFFLPDRDEAPDTIGLMPLMQKTLTNLEVIYTRVCDEGYVNPGDELPSQGEFSIEVVARKTA
ncbi:MAG: class I SAM-dependent methyltransferase [Gammaproteobacteria bacterium]|nr:class I SAM-dependent methyltransferase [Gammaproteobacteria bacterium]MDH5651850.1 class I SAM-dependent methyltransferase [Gammaproteobacteria bacterium]